MVQHEAVVHGPLIDSVDGHAGVPQVGQLVHEQAGAGGGGQGIHNVDFAVGVFFLQFLAGQVGGVDHAGDAAGQAQVQDIQPLIQEGSEVLHKLLRIDLGGLGGGAVHHGGVELIQRHGLAQVVRVSLVVQVIVEAGVVNVPLAEMLGAQVCGRAAAQNVVCHFSSHFLQRCTPVDAGPGGKHRSESGTKPLFCPIKSV